MNKQHTSKTIYLFIVISIFASQAVGRIYKFGRLIETNLKVAELTAKKQELTKERNNLQQTLNTKYSLTAISMLKQSEYAPISEQVVLNFNHTLALR